MTINDEQAYELARDADLDWHAGWCYEVNRYTKLANLAIAKYGAALSAAPVGDAQPLDPDEGNPVVLWAEIWRLRAEAAGPGEYATWKDAAIDERIKRVRAERAAPVAQPAPQALSDEQVFADDTFMALNASLGLSMAQIMALVRCVERAHGITANPAPTVLGMSRAGCNYVASAGRICNKCGHVHTEPSLVATPAPTKEG